MADTKIQCDICGQIKEKYHWQKYHQPHCRPEVSLGMINAYKNGRAKSWNKGLNKKNCSSMQKQSNSLKKHWRENNHPKGMLGKKHSNKTKEIMSNNRQKEKGSNWKGGITKIIRGIRRSPEYYQWRKKVFKNDNYECHICKSKIKLNAHHIYSISEFPQKIFEKNNGIVLCMQCHKEIHNGKIKNSLV